MNENKLKHKLKNGDPCIGTFVRAGAISVEILGYSGWDFIIIDMEHGVHNISDVAELARTAKSVGMSCIVRIPEPRPILVMRALDAGADGVQIPQIDSKEQAEEIIKAARYYPYGNRGMCIYTRAAGYSTIPYIEHFESSNNEVMTVIHIENEKAALNIEEIASVSGLDVAFCGPWDLSQSLGIPGQTKHPMLINLIENVIKVCNKKGIPTGIFIREPSDIKFWLDKGIKYITYSTDVGMLAEQCKESLNKMRSFM